MSDMQEYTELAPGEEEIGSVNAADVLISEGVRWVEPDGTHVIRSLEFDLSGHGDTLEEAVFDFNMNAGDLFTHVRDLVDSNEATDAELRLAAVLGGRIAEASKRFAEDADRDRDRQLRHMINLRRPVGRKAAPRRQPVWRASTLRKSTRLLRA